MIRAGAGDTSRLHEPDAELLRAIVDSIPARVTIVGNDHRYIYVNREFLEFTGLDATDVIGRPVADILGEKVYRALAPLRARVQAGETVRREGWLSYRGSEPRFVQQIFTPYRAGGQEIEGYFVFARDMTDLKLRERELAEQVTALQASKAWNAAVISSALDCILVIDEAGLVVEFNPAAERTFGYARDEAIGRSIGSLIVVPDYLGADPASGSGQRHELQARRADGETFPVELTITELRLHDRRLLAAHLRDLTAAKAAQAEIERQRARLHQVEKLSAMGSLLAGVAHELNNPLAVVLAQASLLEAKADSPDLRARAEKIQAAAARAGRIVKSFLAMARQRPPRREKVDLNAILTGAAEMTAYGRRSAGVELEAALAPELPSFDADPDMLGQVIANLLVNAAQVLADMPGARRIRMSSEVDGNAVVVKVADNGPGVPDGDVERVFEPYFTTKPVGAGTGIGLTISRNIVEAHGGTLDLVRPESGGALFVIRLPIVPGEASAAEATVPPKGSLSVLVVDDEPDLAESLAQMLDRAGHRSVVAHSGDAALAHLRSRRFDVVFADLRMPGMSGIDLHGAMAAIDPAPARTFVVMTGDTIAGPDQVAERLPGNVVLLEKPFTIDDVAAALARVPVARGIPSAR